MYRFKEKTLLILIILAPVLEVTETSFNAVYMKQTEANFTCGNSPEDFFETQQGFLSAEDRIPLTCNSSDPANAYPPQNMVDGSLSTHWQSKGGEDLAIITIHFEQTFFVQDMNITFGNYRRPGAIKVEKSTDFGATFTPWHYLVTSPAVRQCSTQFGVAAYQGVISSVDQVLCTEYSRYFPPEYNETIYIDLNQPQRGDGTPDPYTSGFQAWMNATAVRFTFSGLFRKFDTMATLWHHYTVREIELSGRCDCKGHGDGNHCPLNQSTGLRSCQCKGNTCGVNCDTCCPMFNQFAWKIGGGAPWTNDVNTKCEPCNCHNHAVTCAYNRTVHDLGLSISINGSRMGGGVCLNCQHNTQGINCEKCQAYFYRPIGKNNTDTDACKACNCNRNGTANVSSLSFGDCVRDEDELSRHFGKQPGDCYCKEFVRGRQCDTCQEGYYRLTQDNPQGCTACSCHLNGTKGRSRVCQRDYYGQCNCKPNVDLRDCSQCKDGYYDLQDSDGNGCKACNCDVGGTANGAICDKTTGVCHCRPHVTGTSCNRTAMGFYYPDTHFIQASRNPYKPPTDILNVSLEIPKTGKYRVLVKYTNEGVKAQLNVALQFQNTSGANDPMIFSASLAEGCDNCLETINPDLDYLSLTNGTWMISITTMQRYDQLKLEGVVAIPKEFKQATVLGDESAQFDFLCSVDGNDMTTEPRCLPWLFSVTMDYLNGALACECHPLGSNSSICQEYGGQCSCKQGVEGRDCSRCKPGFYNLTEEGCTLCGCNGPNKVCDVITGKCECPENTVGRTCEPCQCNNNSDRCLRTGECLECQSNTTGFYCQHCDDGTFGNAVIQQCEACACSKIGSLGQSCDRVTGQCNCKTSVTGRNCTLCETNTFNFGPTGCEDCRCNSFGSASLQCNSSGQCPCQANATGLKCTQCASGFYGLPEGPCGECDCNTTGTIPGTVCTNDTIGQCQCKLGVTGRSCDQCMKFFTNLSDKGCEACSMCIQNLRQSIENNSYVVNETSAEVMQLKDFANFNNPMVDVSRSLQRTKTEREQFYARISAGNIVYQNVMTSDLPEANNSLLSLSTRAQDLRSFSKEAGANSTNTLVNIIYEKNATLSAKTYLTSVDTIIEDVRNTLEEHHVAALKFQRHSAEALRQTMIRNFSQYSQDISQKLWMAENTSVLAEQTLEQVMSKLFHAQKLEISVQEKAANYIQIQESWNQSHATFKETIEKVYNYSGEMHATLTEAKNLLENELHALNSSKFSLADTNMTLNNTRLVLTRGSSIFEEYQSSLSPVNGELEVSMLQYERRQTQFVLRIERGRNLPPKDLSRRTSDPYVLVSIIPDWNNEGTKTTSTVNGDLNPSFPFGDVIRFTISMEHLNITKLKLAVYDHDPGEEDDLIGMALIDLSKVENFLDNIVTEWYPLIPQDLSEISSGNFVPQSGLTDVSNLLEMEVDSIKQKLFSAEVKLYQAENQASYLQSLANQMDQTFNRSQTHGAEALSAIDRYSEISKIVNRSLSLVEQANNTVHVLDQQLSVFSLAYLQTGAQKAWQGWYELYNVTEERNATIQNLEKAIYQANLTFLNSLDVWNDVYKHFPAIQDAAVQFRIAAAKAPDVSPPLMQAQDKVTNASVFLSTLEDELNVMGLLIETLLNKTWFIKESSQDGIELVNDAFSNVQNISAKLVPNPNEPKVNATVREAKTAMDSLSPIRSQVETRMTNVSDKLNQVRRMAASLPLALLIMNNSWVEFVPSAQTIGNPLKNEISFDIKTNVTEGLVMYLIAEPREKTTERSNWLTKSLAFFISNSSISVVYDLGPGPITAQNPLVLKNDTWYNVYFTRFEAEAFLTVSADRQIRETISINGSSVNGRTLQFSNESIIYLGGVPSNVMGSLPMDHFRGMVDNLVIDNYRYNLWNSAQSHDGVKYAVPRYKPIYYPADGKAVSFYGNGFLQHAVGQFNVSSGYASVELDFRTLHQNGIMMAVSSEEQRYVLVLYLHNGQVKYFFELGENDGITMTSSGSSYGDGCWYHVRIMRTSVNATLTVNPVGSAQTSDSHFVDTGQTVMADSHLITFGALNPNSVVVFEANEVFSGDMKNLLLYSSVSSSLIPRLFNDPTFMFSKQGLSFRGVIKGEIEYGTRFYGFEEEISDCSYATIDIISGKAAFSTLHFTFKTKEESGVLLYSEKNTEDAPSLYMALRHGDLYFWLGDIESVPVFSSSNITFSDNSWRTVLLQLTDNGYELYVNNTLVYTGVYNFAALSLVLHDPFYMGGIPSNKSSQTPYALCFKGGMKNLTVDSSLIDFLSEHTVGVSKAGVVPAFAPPPIPPSCSASLPPPVSSSSSGALHFDLQESRGKGFIGFNLNEIQSIVFESRFVVGLSFRALSDDGLLLYGTDNDTHPTQFFSLELVHGKLVFKFNSGKGLVSMTSEEKYSGNGQWFSVHILRLFHFGAMLTSTMDYVNGRHDPPSLSMNLRHLYIGGLPSYVVAPTVTNRFLGFAGCMKDFDVANSESLFDFNKPDSRGSNETRGLCYDKAQPGLGFNGSSWARFDDFNLSAEFNVQVTFRTSSRDGLLFMITSAPDSTAGNRMHIRLEQKSGKMILTYNTTTNESQIVWTKPGLGNDTQSSYMMCQMNWHTVRVTKQGSNLTVALDDVHSVTKPVRYGTNMTGHLFLGGYPADQLGGYPSVFTGFKGCLKKFTVDGNTLHFADLAQFSYVSSACPLTSSEGGI